MSAVPYFTTEEDVLILMMACKGRIVASDPRKVVFVDQEDIQRVREKLELSDRRYQEIEEEATRIFWVAPFTARLKERRMWIGWTMPV